MVPTAQHITECEEGVENLLTKECLHSYTSNWNLVHYKYAAYSGTYLELPKYMNLTRLIKITENYPLFCKYSHFFNF